MALLKRAKDQIIKAFWGKIIVPRGLLELYDYFRLYGPINFRYEKNDGKIIAISTNYKYGSIVTSGDNEKELDKNIKDAILTSFEVPLSFAKEAKIHRMEERQESYALA
jgi:hypothetical protein